MFESQSPFTVLGLLFVVIGVLLLAMPYVINYAVKHGATLEMLERVPPILLYVYHRDNFYFATSPILLIAGAVYLIWLLMRWGSLG